MAKSEVLAVAKNIYAYMEQLAEDEELYYDDIANELGGEEELQQALLAKAVVMGLIEPNDALLPIFQVIEGKLSEIVQA